MLVASTAYVSRGTLDRLAQADQLFVAGGPAEVGEGTLTWHAGKPVWAPAPMPQDKSSALKTAYRRLEGAYAESVSQVHYMSSPAHQPRSWLDREHTAEGTAARAVTTETVGQSRARVMGCSSYLCWCATQPSKPFARHSRVTARRPMHEVARHPRTPVGVVRVANWPSGARRLDSSERLDERPFEE